jgi:DNA processing protein
LALQNNLKTFAFIGSGFNCLFPSANKNLSEKIIKTGGAIISEYPINASPQKHYFVARNRLISGSSKAVLIVEAQEKSGTLITARFAMEQDRDILAIPNNIFEKNSKGTNNLIREGAVLVESAEDVFEELGIEKNLALDFEKIDVSLSKVQKEIVNLFEKNNEIDVDFIYENLGLPVEAILSELTILELEGIIRQTKNEAYIKII